MVRQRLQSRTHNSTSSTQSCHSCESIATIIGMLPRDVGPSLCLPVCVVVLVSYVSGPVPDHHHPPQYSSVSCGKPSSFLFHLPQVHLTAKEMTAAKRHPTTPCWREEKSFVPSSSFLTSNYLRTILEFASQIMNSSGCYLEMTEGNNDKCADEYLFCFV